MNELTKLAEILIDSGYADGSTHVPTTATMNYKTILCLYHGKSDSITRFEYIKPFDDTLEGRRQADAIEDWLWVEHPNLWTASVDLVKLSALIGRNSRLDRIKWCLQELVK